MDLFAGARATPEEQALLAGLESRVEKLAEQVRLFEERVHPEKIARLNPIRADVLAKELDLMEQALKRVRIAVLAAGI